MSNRRCVRDGRVGGQRGRLARYDCVPLPASGSDPGQRLSGVMAAAHAALARLTSARHAETNANA
jgi:hypothetical protein